jgi:hypothetical protein
MERLSTQKPLSADDYPNIFLSGLALLLGLLTNSPVLFVAAAVIAPFPGWLSGLSLSVMNGSWHFFLQALGGSLVNYVWIFICGIIAGWLNRSPDAVDAQNQAALYGDFSIPLLAVLSLTAAWVMVRWLRKPDQKPRLAGILVSYALLLPLGAAGFGLSSGQAGLWPDALVVFITQLLLAILVGVVVLATLRFKPLNAFGYVLGAFLAACLLLIAMDASGLDDSLRSRMAAPIPAPILQDTATAQPSATRRSLPATATPAPTRTVAPSATALNTATVEPTAAFARINSAEGDGAFVRSNPSFSARVLITLLNGIQVEMLPETEIIDNITWTRIRLENGDEGWVLLSLLATATPVPGN